MAVCAALIWTVLPVAPGAAPAQALPAGFRDELVAGGFTLPTAVAFAPDGRVYIAEKRGTIKVLDSVSDATASTFADLRTQVHDYLDRGLLGIAVDPDPGSSSVHVVYSHDAPIGGTAPTYNDKCPRDPGNDEFACVGSARLSRLPVRADGTAGPEQVLIEDWCTNYPSHSVGTVLFGDDGALYAGAGDGAWPNTDYGQRGSPANGCGDPPRPVGEALSPPTAEGGSLRAQDLRTPDDPVTLSGTIIRVDPDTGNPWPGNPLMSSSDPNARRIVAMGLRNPFRFTLRPGTSEIWAGDVGQFNWEEVNRIPEPRAGVMPNFGWPCYEGPAKSSRFDALDLDLCNDLYAESGADAAIEPWLAYRHVDDVVSGESCDRGAGDSITGGVFYRGGSYPERYHGAYFFGDYARKCLWVAPAGSDGLPDPDAVENFSNDVGGMVDLKSGPGGDLYYVRIDTGELRRIRYGSGDGGNTPPVARITADPTSGPVPLEVRFDASTSFDPDGDPVTFAWDLDGDGDYDDSTAAKPIWTYTEEGSVQARVQVRDAEGATATAAVTVVAGSSPPVVRIDAPTTNLRWAVGDEIDFAGAATDATGKPLPPSALSWNVVLHHCIASSDASDCHEHPLQSISGVAEGTFTAPDHEYPSFLELRLTATDGDGLTASQTVRLDPRTADLRFTTLPAGLRIAAGEGDPVPSPWDYTAIVGMPITVSAPDQEVGGVNYTFGSWLDGGERTRTIIAAEPGGTYTAVFPQPGIGMFDGDPETVDRVQGPTAVEQAVTVSRARFTPDSAEHVVLARGDVFADALAGSALLARGPLLLVDRDEIPAPVAEELERVLADQGRVYLLGGTEAISETVRSQLVHAGYEVVRLSGPTRVETAVAVTRELLRLTPDADTVLVARADAPGSNPTAAWADSLTGAAVAAATGAPLLLTPTAYLHPAVAAVLTDWQPGRIVLLGGSAALSDAVAGGLPGSQRVGGLNRADTAGVVAEQLWPGDGERYVLINGYEPQAWAFGLPMAGLAADAQAPMLLGQVNALPPETARHAAAACVGPDVEVLLAGPTSQLAEVLAEHLRSDDLPGGACD